MPKDDRTFITVHDGIDEHPKIEQLSDAAFRLLISTWAWCSRNRTDGKVRATSWAKRGSVRARKELIAAGLAVVQDSGEVDMHDYLEHQRSAAEIDELTRKRREAGSKGGKAKASATASATANATASATTFAKQSAKQTASKSVAETETDTDKNSSTAVRSPNAPPGFGPRIIRAYVDAARKSGVAAPEEAQTRVERSARSLLAQGYEPDAIETAARNAATGGWTDLATQLQRDTSRTSPTAGQPSTTTARATAALTLADQLEARDHRKAIG